MTENRLNIYVSIMSNDRFEGMVKDILSRVYGINYCFLGMDADFIISDDWQRFGENKPGIFVGKANSKISNLSRKRNVAFMCFENGHVYVRVAGNFQDESLEAERIVLTNMFGTCRKSIEEMSLNEYLCEWAPLLTPKV